MERSERALTTLGRRVAALQDQARDAQLDHASGRARLLDAELPTPRSGSQLGDAVRGRRVGLRGPASFLGGRRVASLIAAGLVLAVLAVVLRGRPRPAMRFEVGAAEPGAVGEWIAAPPAAPLPIRFSDGSRLDLAPRGRARIVSVNDEGAEIALERGVLDLSVVHREHTRWRVRVGPFQIHVIGTRFETRWDPVTEQFDVALREGAITVSGPVIGESRVVRAGERITVSPVTSTLAVGRIDTDSASPPSVPVPTGDQPAGSAPVPTREQPAGSAPVPAGEQPAGSVPVPIGALPLPGASAPSLQAPRAEVLLPPSEPSAAGSANRPTAAPAPPSWQGLALGAKYKDALAAAEQQGFDAICASASASDLHALGDAARLAGRPARAVQAFAALRQRFPGSPDGAAAAFILGRIAQDQSKDYPRAAGYFMRYLSEQPGGAFAAEAAGRLVEAEDRRGDDAAARRAARRYLTAYPKGAHAAFARSVLARGAPAVEPGSPAGSASPELTAP